MATPIIDLYSKEELEKIIKESTSYVEVLQKLGYSTVHGNNPKIVKDRIQKYGISVEHFTSNTSPVKRCAENVFIKNSTASQSTLRRWFASGEYVEYKCSICGLGPVWNNQELTLILDHIDGDNKNDELENLRWVCPNCNQQLPTTGFKKLAAQKLQDTKGNIKQTKQNYCKECGKEISANATLCIDCYGKTHRVVQDRPDAQTLEQLLREENGNFSAVGRKYGVTDNTIRKWCIKYNMPHKTSDYSTKQNTVNTNKIAVSQISLDTNEIVAIYESIAEAKRQTGACKISEVLSGKRKTSGGYYWKKIQQDM